MRKRREKTGLRRFKWSCDGDALDRKGFDLSGQARACGMLSRLAHPRVWSRPLHMSNMSITGIGQHSLTDKVTITPGG